MKLVLFIIFSTICSINASNIHIALRQQNLRELYTNAWSVSDPGSPDFLQFWSEEEIRNLTSPPLKIRKEVTKWLTTIGISPTMLQDRGDSIVFPYSPVYAKSLQTEIPKQLVHVIDMIIGLEPVTKRPTFSKAWSKDKVDTSVDPGIIGREVIERAWRTCTPIDIFDNPTISRENLSFEVLLDIRENLIKEKK